MSRKHGTLSRNLLALLGEATGFFTWPLDGTDAWRWQQLSNYKSKKVYDSLHHLKSHGYIKELSKNGKRFFELTKKGEIENLFIKAYLVPKQTSSWDGKWRLVVFDIPEEAKIKRDILRRLLKKHNFIKLQASVFVSPYALNRDAIVYLKQTGLSDYIRLARIDELDNDKDLKKKFKLT